MNENINFIQTRLDSLNARLEQLDIKDSNCVEEIKKIETEIAQIKEMIKTEKSIREELRIAKLRLAHLNANRDNPLYADEFKSLKQKEQALRRMLARKKLESKTEGRNR